MHTKNFLNGIKKTFPLMIGVIPFGLAYGIMGSQAGLTIWEITFMSMVVFAGSAQFMAIEMISKNIGFTFIVFSTFLINLRHLLMGLSLSPYLNKLKTPWLYGLAFGMVDESYAVTVGHYQNSGSNKGNPYFMLGSAVGMYVFWLGSSFTGGLLGLSINNPLSWGLDFAMVATFLSILVPQIKSVRMLAVILISGVCSIFAFLYIPGKWYIIIATVVATFSGTMMEIIQERRLLKYDRTM
jgi:4-azaleucine resistance transporter AzlC